ncbi:MAG: hypothetical protein ACR2IE_06930 [Candidatus Sumerlaeaceae bacterium]
MNTPSDRLRQEHKQAPGNHTPTGVRLKIRRASEEELVEVSPAFRILQHYKPEQPSSSQWREFSRSLAERLDREAEKKSAFRSIQVLRDKFTATDSVALRTTGYVLMILTLGAIAVGIAAAATLAFNAPGPQTSMLPESQPVACYAIASAAEPAVLFSAA